MQEQSNCKKVLDGGFEVMQKRKTLLPSEKLLFSGHPIAPPRHRRSYGEQDGLFHDLRSIIGVLVILSISLLLVATCHEMPWFWEKWSLAGPLVAILTARLGDAGFGRADSILQPYVFQPLPLGSVNPKGWLSDQLELAAAGLAGHEHEFYSYVNGSPWLGGVEEYSKLNEAFPYWFNGLVPLAYSINDDRLKQQIRVSVSYILDHQADDGWIGPETVNSGLRNFWGRYPMLLGLTGLLEADKSYESTVLPALRRFTNLTHGMLKNNGSGLVKQPGDILSDQDHGWGRIRIADFMITIQWMYENDKQGAQAEMLLEILDMLQSGSLDWSDWYREGVYIKEDLTMLPESEVEKWFPYEHGVNVAQGLKSGGVINRFTHNDSYVEMARKAVDWTFRYHGSASGSILADERLRGLGPFYGSELCTTVETIFSLTYLYQTIGDRTFADKAELAAFNAFPAALTPDWWAHQYVTQPNQPFATALTDTPFWNVNIYGQTFGLEPNYPCCTVNHPQGYPKFLAASWVLAGNEGLAHALLSPSVVRTTLGNGAKVEVNCDTKFPFMDLLSYSITSSAAFTFYFRIPSWSDPSQTRVQVAGTSSLIPIPDPRTGLYGIKLPSGQSSITLTLSRSIDTVPRANNSVAIMHGPLLYTLDVGGIASNSTPKGFRDGKPLPNESIPPQSRDWSIVNGSSWNIAVDTSTLKVKSFWTESEPNSSSPLPNPIWTPGAPPTYLEAMGCEIPWPMWKGVPGPVPKDRECASQLVTVRFLPFGSAKVGMAELPVLNEK